MSAPGPAPAPAAERPTGAGSVLRIAAIEAGRGQLGQALDRLDTLAEQGSLSVSARVLRSHILAKMGRLEEAWNEAEYLHVNHPTRPDGARQLVRVAHILGRIPQGLVILKDALNRWPGDLKLLSSANRMPIPDDDFRDVYKIMRDQRPLQSFNAVALFEYGLASMRMGEIDTAREALAKSADTNPAADRMIRALSRFTQDEWNSRNRIRNDPTITFQKVVHPGAENVLIVFPGARAKFGQMHLGFLDALLHDFEVHIIYLNDTSSRGFLKGIPGMGEDLGDTIITLGEIIEELGASRILTTGSSFGGFAALRYGVLLEAERVLTVSGHNRIRTADEEFEDAPPAFVKFGVRRFAERDKEIRAHLIDNPQLEVTQVVAALDRQDMWQAKQIDDLPNVRTHFVEMSDNHAGVFQDMVGTGEFTALLSQWLEF